jgi:D-alanyl-D-alanine carboxypeptidase
MVSTLHDLRIWVPRLATGRGLLSAATQRARLRSLAGPETGTYGLGMFAVGGWIGHNGSLPGYQTVALYHPRTRTTIVALINADIARGGVAPSTAIGEAIRKVVSPRNVHRLPASP